jgi:hypothetical protein
LENNEIINDSENDPDYETVGAKILVSHARDEMQAGVSRLRSCLKSAFSPDAPAPADRPAPVGPAADD